MKERIDSGKQQQQGMNWDEVSNNLEEFKTRVHDRWNELSNNQIDSIEGRRENLSREIQRAYGVTSDEAETQIRAFESGTTGFAGAGSGRGSTERSREYGSGNQQGSDRANPRDQRH